MDKRQVIAAVVASLEAEVARLAAAARATHAEATDPENKAENKYDTRGLEASYLAHGQSVAARELAQALEQYAALAARDFGAGDPVSLGALVTIAAPASSVYFIGPGAGGTEVRVHDRPVVVLTPQSPLGRQLMGRRQGDVFQAALAGRPVALTIASVS
ncbi:MAG TPA: transcription elongation factor [Lacunisphaera sp.]|nr:transcription elongation factor [Lacunisphaera sp.]